MMVETARMAGAGFLLSLLSACAPAAPPAPPQAVMTAPQPLDQAVLVAGNAVFASRGRRRAPDVW